MIPKKNYIFLYSLLGIFVGVVLIFATLYETEYFEIIIDPIFKYNYKDGNWSRNEKKLNLIQNGFDIYDSNGYLGNHSVPSMVIRDLP